MAEQKKVKLKCKNCNYEWETSSELLYVSCPNCLKKVLNPNGVVKKR
jgi:DNA-directed RNA polymerase subunit RPC12/RpoP